MRFALFAFALLFSLNSYSQYPNKPVRLIVGYAAGSSTDIVARVMADRLSAYWKEPVIVETRAGAAGNLAADAVAKATGDGYTLLFAQNGLAISAALLSNLPFKAETDLMPLAPTTATPHILIVPPDAPYKSVKELIAAAKAQPGKLSYASSGVGNSDHLCGELFNAVAGIQAIHVPYKGGAPASVDVMAGRIAYYFAGMPVGLPLHKSGRAPALAVTSQKRFEGGPEIPTVGETLPGFEHTLWQGLFAPASLPADLGARISADIQAVLKLPETREKLKGASVVLWEDNQENFRRAFLADIQKWRDLSKKTGLKLD